MKIGINLLFLIPKMVGGTETYSRNLIWAFANLSMDNIFYVFLNREAISWELPKQDNFIRVVCPVQATSRAQRYFYEQFRFRALYSNYNLDVLHSLGYVGPIFPGLSHIVTIHDLNFIGHGRKMNFIKKTLLEFFVKATIANADRLIAVSQFSKDEIINYLNINPKLIKVIYEASSLQENKGSVEAFNEPTFWQEYGKYLIAFSSFHKQKNIEGLLMAYALIKDVISYKLVLVGNYNNSLNLMIQKLNLKEKVILTGYVDNQKLRFLLKEAELFIFPSLYEGFGLPLLESQTVGTAVLSSNKGSLPEIGLDSVMYFNPYSPTDISEKILSVLNDQEILDDLVKKGFDNVMRFSWDRAGQETLLLYAESLVSC